MAVVYPGLVNIDASTITVTTVNVYDDNQRTVFTTAGAGTSLFPIRVGTKSSWDLLEVRFISK